MFLGQEGETLVRINLQPCLGAVTRITADHKGRDAGGGLSGWEAIRGGVVTGEPNVRKCINKDVQPRRPGI